MSLRSDRTEAVLLARWRRCSSRLQVVRPRFAAGASPGPACSTEPARADSSARRNMRAASSWWTAGQQLVPSPTWAAAPFPRAKPIGVVMNPLSSSRCVAGGRCTTEESTACLASARAQWGLVIRPPPPLISFVPSPASAASHYVRSRARSLCAVGVAPGRPRGVGTGPEPNRDTPLL